MVELTGMMASNIARFENGGRVPTLLVLQKYAGALGKHIELKVEVKGNAIKPVVRSFVR